MRSINDFILIQLIVFNKLTLIIFTTRLILWTVAFSSNNVKCQNDKRLLWTRIIVATF